MPSIKEEIRGILKDIILEKHSFKSEPVVEISPKPNFGDFSSNLASILSGKFKESLGETVREITAELKKRKDVFSRVESKGNFVNLFLNKEFLFGRLRRIIDEGERFGSSTRGARKRILVEFVSANPTGPLNIVSARAAAVGDVLVKLFNFSGYKADAEFYINDAGRQIDLLGISAEKRYEELHGNDIEIPEDGYKGEYITECVKKIKDDKKLKGMSETERTEFFAEYVKNEMIDQQRNSLNRFGVGFKDWISEKEILDKFSVQEVIKVLRDKGDVYEKDGAVWFATTKYGDDKDRVLIKQNGTHTYIVSDASYHRGKFKRGYEYLINLWGPDHHGDIARLKAAVQAFGFDPAKLEIIIVQQVTLVSKGKKEKMSKRAGKFITLDSLLDSVDKDAIRFFFLMRRTTAHLDFDVELAKSLSLENPVYYTQYCYARTCNILSFAREKRIQDEEVDITMLNDEQEREIARMLLLFPEVVENATERRDVHTIPYYLLNLSKAFHSYYQKERIVTDNIPLSVARLLLTRAVKQVMSNGLALIGVNAPEKM